MKSAQKLSELENILLKLENLNASFDYLKIRIASPQRIKSWSERILPNGEILGEVLKPETINFRTHQPEIHGLFCEKIFGPIKNWKCRCGKYNGFAIDKICEECHVEVIESRVRRYRTGYIELVSPVTHLWYLKGMPNYLTILLKCIDEDLSTSKIEKIVYFKDKLEVVEKKNSLAAFIYQKSTKNNELLSIVDNIVSKTALKPQALVDKVKGSEILKSALEALNISDEIKKARSLINTIELKNKTQFDLNSKLLARKIRILESFCSTNTNPSWLVLTVLPVLPPTLRPLVELENGRLVSADINEIYRLIITRNHRLSDFLYRYNAPDLISIQGRKLLQESVDSLIDNARLQKNKIFSLNNRALKSLSEILEGKQGRFRQSLLGKRVDYSGRSVIIVGPSLRLNECGLPYEIAVELFQPFLINELLKIKIKSSSHYTKLAHIIIKKNKPFIWSLLRKLTKKHCVLLNRAPTLHRFGIQAFNPILVLGQALHLHPLVCTGFNADFDGDQMAVHLPLYAKSELEVRTMMRPSYNILSTSNGDVILKPSQDMVIGCYYLTFMAKKNIFQIKKWFANEEEVLSSFYQKLLSVHTPVLVRYKIELIQTQLKTDHFYVQDSTLIKTQRFIKIYKKLLSKNNCKKQYLLTNIGIIIAYEINKQSKIFQITDLLLETTPGRLIFSRNIKNIIT